MGLSPHLDAAVANHPGDRIAQVSPTVFDDFRMQSADWQTKRTDKQGQVAFVEDGTLVIPPLGTEMPISTAMKGGGASKDISKQSIDNSHKSQCSVTDENPANWSQMVNDGDTYLVDSFGNVMVYAYADRTGMMQDTFQVKREDCKITEILQSGKTWFQVEDNQWMYVTDEGQVSPRLYEFEFKMDENGVSARGKDSHFLNIPGHALA